MSETPQCVAATQGDDVVNVAPRINSMPNLIGRLTSFLPPFPNTVNGLFARWMCKKNPGDLANK